MKILFGLQGKKNISLVNNKGCEITAEDVGKLNQHVLFVVDTKKRSAVVSKEQEAGIPAVGYLLLVKYI